MKAVKLILVSLLAGGLFYAAYVLPSQMLSDTKSHTIVTPSQAIVTPRLTVSVDVLEVRSGAGESYQNIGYLTRGQEVQVLETQVTPNETCKTWARVTKMSDNVDGRIQPNAWVCFERLK